MYFARYYRDDLINGHPVELDFSILPNGGTLQDLHHWATVFGQYRPTASSYQLFEGTNLKSGFSISLKHRLP